MIQLSPHLGITSFSLSLSDRLIVLDHGGFPPDSVVRKIGDQQMTLNTALNEFLSRSSLKILNEYLLKNLTSSWTTNLKLKNVEEYCSCHAIPESRSSGQSVIRLFFLMLPNSSALLKKIEELEDYINHTTHEHQKHLKEATQSLIDTNVALRREIRERQHTLNALKYSESRFRNLAERTSDFIWEIDRNGRYTYASPMCIKLMGIQPEEMIGTPFFLLRDPSTIKIFIDTVENCSLDEGFSDLVYTVATEEGVTRVISSSGEPIVSARGELEGFRGIDRDVTKRHIYEQELKAAKVVAEQSNQAKSEFLANMSHELRTPLHAILSFAGYGIKKSGSCPPEESKRFFQQIQSAGKRLLPLVDSLLDLAKLEAGMWNYRFRSYDLRTEIRSAIHEMECISSERAVSIQFEEPKGAINAIFDPASVGRVLRNLLSNAIKFASEKSVILISVKLISSDDHCMYQTTVMNRGISIPETELEIIFDKFIQSSVTRSGAGGTGLGLSISRKIIHDHGGKIWAEQDCEGYTSFHFTLPCETTCRSTAFSENIIQAIHRGTE